MIERVEVLRGGGSALYGSSAIGGTINIITREPTRSSAQLSHTLTSLGGSNSYDNNTMLNASIVSESGRAGISVFGQSRHRSGYDHDGDGFTELPVISSQSVGMRSFFRTGAYSRITAQYHHIDEYRRGGDLLKQPPHEAFVAEQTDHAIDGGSLSFDISSADRSNHFNAYASFQNTARKSYYGSKQDLDAYGTTHDLTLAAGMQYVHAFRKLLFMPSELTLGTEYSYDDLSDRSIGYDIRTDQTVHIVGAYLQNEWKTRKWSLLIGGRLDKHSLVDHAIFSPRANVRFNPSESVNLRVSYAGGYRAPQAFDEDMHIAIVGGKRVRIRLADDLKEERSHSVSLSADLYHTFGRVQTNLLVEGFYTRLDDVFALRDIEDTADGGKIKERYNGSGATVRGQFHGRRDGNLHGRDARAAHGRIGRGAGCGRHDACVLRREPASGLRPAGLQGDHPPALRRRAESVQRLPEGFRQGRGPRFGLHLRTFVAPQLVHRREGQLLIDAPFRIRKSRSESSERLL